MPAADTEIVCSMGWIPDLPDFRDNAYAFSAGLEDVAKLPAKHDRFTDLPPIWNQGRIGSCTAQGILRIYLKVMKKLGYDTTPLSRLMLYYLEREAERTIRLDAGAQIRTGIQMLVKYGCCLESEWPYDDTPADPRTGNFAPEARPAIKPTDVCFKSAQDHQLLVYRSVAPTLDQVKAALLADHAVVYGCTMYPGATGPQARLSGIWPIPNRGERPVGGHAKAFNGYWDDEKQLIGFDNSWDIKWGYQGTGFLPYWYFQAGLVSDCWIMEDAEGKPTRKPDPKPEPHPVPHPGDFSQVERLCQAALAASGKTIHVPAIATDSWSCS